MYTLKNLLINSYQKKDDFLQKNILRNVVRVYFLTYTHVTFFKKYNKIIYFCKIVVNLLIVVVVVKSTHNMQLYL